MSKIGILTLNRAENYGATLQCFSLCETLNEYGAEAEIIDVTPSFMIGRYRIWRIDTTSLKSILRSVIGNVLSFHFKYLRKIRFYKFWRKNLILSRKHYLRKVDNDEYDKYIVGSDQVWNLELTNDDKMYFLDFVNDNKKKFSYAASFGVDNWSMEQKQIISYYCKKFERLSIREEVGKRLVEDLTNRQDIRQDIDPVFLHDKKFWESFAAKRCVKKKYILIYTFVDLDSSLKIATNICAKEEELEVVVLGYGWRKRIKGALLIKDAGPSEFLSLILYAEYVITDSFHGSAFSIIFEKKFWVLPYDKTSSRMKSMLNIINLNSRFLEKDNIEKEYVDNIDYKMVKRVLINHINASKEYIEGIIFD